MELAWKDWTRRTPEAIREFVLGTEGWSLRAGLLEVAAQYNTFQNRRV
jgi:hypothetical protein